MSKHLLNLMPSVTHPCLLSEHGFVTAVATKYRAPSILFKHTFKVLKTSLITHKLLLKLFFFLEILQSRL